MWRESVMMVVVAISIKAILARSGAKPFKNILR